MLHKLIGILAVCAGLISATSVFGQARLTVYLDADYSLMPAPAEAIELGLRSAFAGTWAEEGIELVRRDHRMNARRSLDTILDARNDPNAIAVIGGMHSVPYIANGDRINALGIPLFLPWSTASSLTRLDRGEDNWIFRLSVDDSLALRRLAGYAASEGCTRPAVVVVDDPWGVESRNQIQTLLAELGIPAVEGVRLYSQASDRNISNAVSRIMSADSDCVLLFANYFLSAKLLNSLAELRSAPVVISHWGLLGRKPADEMSQASLMWLWLRVLGTCGLHRAEARTYLHDRAREAASAILGREYDPAAAPAPHGFFHGYDLGLLLMSAIHFAQARGNWPDDPALRRAAMRQALYRLDMPTYGLLRTYVTPFSPVSSDNPMGHEALDTDDLCFTTLAPDGRLVPI